MIEHSAPRLHGVDDRVADWAVEHPVAEAHPLVEHVGEPWQLRQRAGRDRGAVRVVRAAVGIHLGDERGGLVGQAGAHAGPWEAVARQVDERVPRVVHDRARRARPAPGSRRPRREGRPSAGRHPATRRSRRPRRARMVPRRRRSAPRDDRRPTAGRWRRGHRRGRTSEEGARSRASAAATAASNAFPPSRRHVAPASAASGAAAHTTPSRPRPVHCSAITAPLADALDDGVIAWPRVPCVVCGTPRASEKWVCTPIHSCR